MAWPTSRDSSADVSELETRSGVRRTDWRFLLPSPAGGRFDHLVLLGGPRGLPEQVLALGIARSVSTIVPEGRSADCVVRLFDAGVGVHTAGRCLKPGGVMYYEVDRRDADARLTTPGRVRRQMRAAGLSTGGVYWVRDSFGDHRLYVPAELPAAVAWYFSSVHEARSRRERVVTSCYRLAAVMGARVLGQIMRCFAVTATCGGPGTRGASVLAIPGLPGDLRKPGLRTVVIAPRIRRVVFLPFEPRGRAPIAALKVSRFTVRNVQTEHEQHVLARLRSCLDRRLLDSVPEPLGVFGWGELAVGVESCVSGRMLGRLPRAWPAPAAASRLDDLRAVADWLGDFHRQTSVRGEWDREAVARLENTLLSYDRAFGVAAAEAELFAAVLEASRSLLRAAVPTVWRHGDLAPGNIFRGSRGIAVIDWEHAREGLPLLDLLFFIDEWLYNAPGARSLASKIERFERVFVGGGADEPYGAGVQAAIAGYMARLELDPRLYPVLHVLLRVERAVAWFNRAEDPDLDEVGREMTPRCVGYVRALAAGAERLFAAPAGPSPAHGAGADLQ
jgi:hypothetical protein